MTSRPARIVDAHVHFWDPARIDWYPYLSGRKELALGDVSGMSRRFDVATYETEATGWNVEKLVNVAAATGAHSIDETLALDERASRDGHPDAIVGGIIPTTDVANAERLLDRQMQASRFRGVRPMGTWDVPLPPEPVLRAVQERGLLFELMTHPDQLQAAADGVAAVDDLVVVVEHAGWPRSTSEEEVVLWRSGMESLAAVGERVVCKLSGLTMLVGSMEPAALAPWIDFAIETFGVDRCMFASNFPVDGMHGTLHELFTAYSDITADLDEESREKVFASNAERVYRC